MKPTNPESRWHVARRLSEKGDMPWLLRHFYRRRRSPAHREVLPKNEAFADKPGILDFR